MPLTQEQIEALLAPKTRSTKPQVRTVAIPRDDLIIKQIGPIRWVGERGYCASGFFSEEFKKRFECRIPTYCKFQGVYYCHTHALEKANKLLVEKEILE